MQYTSYINIFLNYFVDILDALPNYYALFCTQNEREGGFLF